MRRIAEMEEVLIKILKLHKQARQDEKWENVYYWEGVIDTLRWVRDKKGEESYLFGHNY